MFVDACCMVWLDDGGDGVYGLFYGMRFVIRGFLNVMGRWLDLGND